MAELADAQDLKSCGTNLPYRFDSGRRHIYEMAQSFIKMRIGSFLIDRQDNCNARVRTEAVYLVSADGESGVNPVINQNCGGKDEE